MGYAKTLLFLLSLSFASHAAFKYYKRKKRKEPHQINEVIMFSCEENGVLRKSKYSKCMVTRSMDRLLYFINLPRNDLDICMYVLTNLDLTNALMKLHYRGVKIRLIVDADMAYTTGSNIRRLERYGIPIRWMKSTYLMHHKFCLSDTHTKSSSALPFVMAGSMNWTNQALSGNWENVVITSQRELVEQYKAEFERLWNLFKPIVY